MPSKLPIADCRLPNRSRLGGSPVILDDHRERRNSESPSMPKGAPSDERSIQSPLGRGKGRQGPQVGRGLSNEPTPALCATPPRRGCSTGHRNLFRVGFLGLIMGLFSNAAFSQSQLPEGVRNVGIDQRLNEQPPL